MRRLPRGGPRVSSLAQVATALQHVLTTVADQAAQETGFVQRVRKWTGALFVQTLVLGWLGNPAASLSELTQVAAKLGVSVSPQGLAQRVGEPAAKLLERVLRAAVEQVIAAEPVAVPLLQRFTGVFILDGSTIALPDGLAQVWAGCGGRVARGTRAALKLAVRLDLGSGRLDRPVVTAGRSQDRASTLQPAAAPPGALRLADLGFWSLAGLPEAGGAPRPGQGAAGRAGGDGRPQPGPGQHPPARRGAAGRLAAGRPGLLEPGGFPPDWRGGGVLAEPPQSAGDRLRHRRLPARPAELAGAAEGDAPRCASAPGSGPEAARPLAGGAGAGSGGRRAAPQTARRRPAGGHDPVPGHAGPGRLDALGHQRAPGAVERGRGAGAGPGPLADRA